MKIGYSLILALLLHFPLFLEGYGKGVSDTVADLQNTCSRLTHQVNNHRTEIKTFEERLLNFELMLESVREELNSSKDQQKESLNTRNNSLELRIASLEQSNKALIADIKQLTQHANETATTLKGYQQKISSLDQAISKQNRNLSNMQNAINSLIEALDKADNPDRAQYKVKTGDSLAKIAKAHQTTVEAIKALNGMNSDKIIVGKTIKIPCKP